MNITQSLVSSSRTLEMKPGYDSYFCPQPIDRIGPNPRLIIFIRTALLEYSRLTCYVSLQIPAFLFLGRKGGREGGRGSQAYHSDYPDNKSTP